MGVGRGEPAPVGEQDLLHSDVEAAGDDVLQRIAGIFKRNMRASDIAGRYGGEEFCVLLPHTDTGQAVTVAEKLRNAIAEEPFPGMAITASFGVSSQEFGPTDEHDLIDQADRALYAAKREGRDRVHAG